MAYSLKIKDTASVFRDEQLATAKGENYGYGPIPIFQKICSLYCCTVACR